MDIVYEKLYDIVEERMMEHNATMPYSKQAFLFATKTEPGICNVANMNEVNNDKFLELAYIGILGRLPDEGAKKALEYELEQSPEVFQKNIFSNLISSGEAILKSTTIINNKKIPITVRNQELFKKVLSVNGEEDHDLESERKGIKTYLYAAYIKLPLSFRLFVRKVLGRDNG